MQNTLKLLAGFLAVLYPTIQASQKPTDTQPGSAVMLRLLVPEPRACLGSATIAGELILRNLGSKSVAVSLTGLSSNIQFNSYSETPEHFPVGKTMGIRRDPWPLGAISPKEISLGPGESHWISITLPLDRDFFSSEGLYDVSFDHIAQIQPAGASASLEPLETNSVFFELEDCGAQKPPLRP